MTSPDYLARDLLQWAGDDDCGGDYGQQHRVIREACCNYSLKQLAIALLLRAGCGTTSLIVKSHYFQSISDVLLAILHFRGPTVLYSMELPWKTYHGISMEDGVLQGNSTWAET